MNKSVAEKNWCAENFLLFEKELDGQTRQPVHALRKKAFQRFSEIGFPSLRDELWRFTDISPIKNGRFDLPQQRENPLDQIPHDTLSRFFLKDLDRSRLVFVNGRFVKELSPVSDLPPGVVVSNLADALARDRYLVEKYLTPRVQTDRNVFALLNSAFMQNGAYVHVPDNTVLETPIHIVYFTSSGNRTLVTYPRNLLIFGDNVQGAVIESYGGSEDFYFTNPVTDVVVGANSIVEHYKIQRESESAFHVASQHSTVGRDSQFTTHNYDFGGSLVRNDAVSVLNGEGITSTLNGLYLLWKDQHVDNHTLIEHVKPHGMSRELYKGILYDESHAVFNGKIFVHREAQKTDAIQKNKNLVLSESAGVDTQPQLEIFADDVRCTHGGTVGQLDEDGLFYLRSRGISKSEAENIMIHAFAGEVTGHIRIQPVKEQIEQLVLQRLAKNG
ncbi:Fe-S cluster assembly protein SufD [candidate division KSB1 bacterium RBG_16_48_16]|nr:MAG: Fe-S cluster assembly protein SufD [candidate division KSB1 bacterium RBG_16_48_16]